MQEIKNSSLRMSFFEIFDGAREGTWTLTPFGIRTSSVHVYHSITRAKIYGAPSRVRTYNQRFRRPLLFQLSYGCMFLIWISSGIIEISLKKANFFYIFVYSFCQIPTFPYTQAHATNQYKNLYRSLLQRTS